MVNLKFALIAKGFSIDKETNTLSIFNQFDRVGAPGVPFVLAEVCIVALFEREDNTESMPIVLELKAPSKKEEDIAKLVVNFESKKRNRTPIRIQALEITEFGTYTFRLKWEDKNIEIPLEIVQGGKPPTD